MQTSKAYQCLHHFCPAGADVVQRVGKGHQGLDAVGEVTCDREDGAVLQGRLGVGD